MIASDAVWLITGCSKGFGHMLAQRVLESGYRAVVTARRPDEVRDIVATHPDAALALALDVTDPDQIASAVREAENHFGGVDVLVNNAGYGYMGAIEEGDDAEVRALFDTNVFGVVSLIKAVLPGMRKRQSGHIVNLSSSGGFVTAPAVGYYHMAKFAIEALSETLAQEVAPLGIGVTIVEPGPFRTDFRGGSMRWAEPQIAAYAETAGKVREAVRQGDGTQRGNPELGAKAILDAIEAEHPPLHLVLGGDALDQFRRKVATLETEWSNWETVTRSTDFAEEDGRSS